MPNKLFASVLISRKVDIDPVNIINMIDSVLANENKEINCSILLKTRLFGKGIYKVFFVLDCADRFRVLDSFNIESDDEEDVKKYNKAYDLEEFYIPETKQNCIFKVFGISIKEYEEFVQNVTNEHDEQELLDYLEINDSRVLDQEILYIDQD